MSVIHETAADLFTPLTSPSAFCRPSVLVCMQVLFRAAMALKKHSQLVHMRITHHSIANLHITET